MCATIHEIGDDKGWKKETGLANAMVRETGVGGGGWKGYEGAAGSAALIKLAEDNEPVCRLACLAV